MKAKKTIGVDITAEEFDRKFDAGESIVDYLDLDSARRPGLEPKRVNVVQSRSKSERRMVRHKKEIFR